jgi:hypothetical protein
MTDISDKAHFFPPSTSKSLWFIISLPADGSSMFLWNISANFPTKHENQKNHPSFECLTRYMCKSCKCWNEDCVKNCKCLMMV